MKRRYKLILNVDMDEPEKPFPAGGDYMHDTRIEGMTRAVVSHLSSLRWEQVPCSVTLDKVIDKGEV